MDLATPFLPTGSTKSLAQGVKYLPGCHYVKMMECAWAEHLSARWQLAEPGKDFLERNGAQLPNWAAMLSDVGGRGEHVWESILLIRWRARRTSALRNLIWEGRRESCNVRGESDDSGSVCAQQGNSPWPRQWSLTACRLFLPWFCQRCIIPELSPCRFFFFMCRGLDPGLLRRGHLEQADGCTVGASSCLDGLTADGAQ